MAPEPQQTLTILRRRQVEARTGLSRSAIYARMNSKRPEEFDPTFPRPIPLGPEGSNAVGWVEAEIEAWLAAQVAKRDKASEAA